ncbi:carboxy terminal-processing peptidase [Gallibacterium genomosp. 3]|uniref:Carboxy-terminal protease n=1 Tax=Gallibacterium genomosp. 3 TaxID=505345 RepID=A0A1A7PZ51_9PAST|nr:carboxy terminal-processing peptidase [Gallibacterium genomosp. 3]OBX06430.1 carboxy-terminal protease [Gallibacterium genomosp. 3]
MKFKKIAQSIIIGYLFTNVPAWAVKPDISADKIVIPAATEANSTEAKRVTARLIQSHYKKFTLDDAMSEKIFNRYIDFLDYSHNTFLQSDIDELRSKYAKHFDDDLVAGDLSAAFDMYKLLQERRYQRYTYALSLLDKEPNLKEKDQIEIDRSKAPFPKTEEEADKLWKERVKNDVISMRLQGKSWAQIKKKLVKRYNLAIKRLTQTKADDITQLFLNSFARELDPHTSYLSPRNAKSFQEDMNLSLEGIGATLQSEDDETIIKSLVPGAPADKSKKIKAGDKIVGVGQGNKGEIEDVVGWRLDDVVEKIKGKKGTTVRLEIEPAKGGKTKIITLVRDRVRIEDRAAKLKVEKVDDKNIAVITIPGFYNGLTADVVKLLNEMKEKKADALIIDLRNNGGGSLTEVVTLSGLFITDGPVVQVRDAFNRIRVHEDLDPQELYNGPMIVLVDRFSASASEIFSAAMQDYGRAVIVGQNTFGKGTVQQSRPLNFIYDTDPTPLGAIQYTIQKFYRINGGSTQLKGVAPDVKIAELIDESEYGESKEDNALVWDKIPESPYKKVSDLSSIVKTLTERHKERVANDPEFIVLNQDIATRDQRNERKFLSLNLDERKAENDKDDAKRLKDLNERFKREGKKPLKKLDDLPKDYEAPDFVLKEVEHMAVDMLPSN